jgi:hypothetical protein
MRDDPPGINRYEREEAEAVRAAEGECPAGGAHEWGLMEEAGTGRTGWACENCHAPMPKEEW